MIRLLLLLALSCSFFSSNINAQPTPKVLIIGIDGCRSDALQSATTPAIDQLIANATYSFDALTEAPTWSGVGWSGMLTAVWRDKHGVSDNSFSGSNFSAYPHFFNRLNDCNPNLVTASIVHWAPINTQIIDLVDYQLNVSTDLAVRQEAVTYLGNNDPDVLFLHFDEVDGIGHNYGFSPSVSEYISIIEDIDTHVGQVISALENRSNYANESWLIILSTDHGGTAAGHGGSSIDERTIFTIFSGDAVPNEERKKITTATSINDALALNGTDNHIAVPNSSLYDFGSNQDFTIECRVRLTSLSGDPVIISNKNWQSGLNPGYVISFPNNGPAWKVNIGDGSNRVDIDGGDINDGEWHHLAVSFDRDGLMKAYQDGTLIRSENISGIGPINTNFPLTIGQDGTQNYGDWLDGAIADVRLWNTVLDENTIAINACSPLTNTHPKYADLLAYWPINEGSGTTILDASINANHASVSGSGAAWSSNATTLLCHDYSSSLRVVDIAASALEYLCNNIDPSWNLDGQSVTFNSTPLPVDLLAFTAKTEGKNNHLQWTVANEIGIETYVIERQDNQKVFQEIGQISQINNKPTINQYTFIDQQPIHSNYYRLRIENQNGAIEYSPIVFIDRPSNKMALTKVYPSPAKDQLFVNYAMPAVGSVSIKLYNLLGQLMNSQTVKSQKGQNEVILNLSQLPQASYLLLLDDGKTVLRKKVIK